MATSIADTGMSATAARGSRLYFVDRLRAALTVLVILHHLAITYGALGPWYYQEPADSLIAAVVLTVFILMNQAFFMGCFFLIAGYFAPGSYDRKGTGAFLQDRLIRLGVPLLVYELVLGPLATIPVYGGLVAEAVANGLAQPPYWQLYLSNLDPGPLWFAELLLIFSVAYALVRWRTRGRPEWVNGGLSVPSFRHLVVFIGALTIATFLWRLVIPMGFYVPVLGLPTLSHLPQYLGLFVVGIMAARRGWLDALPEGIAPRAFGAAFGATLLLPLALIGLPAFTGGLQWQAAVYALWEAIFCVGMCLGLLATFRRRANQQGALGRFLAGNAFAVYVIHAPLIVGLAYVLRDVELASLVKFVLAAAVAVPLCFLSAGALRSLPVVRRVL